MSLGAKAGAVIKLSADEEVIRRAT